MILSVTRLVARPDVLQLDAFLSSLHSQNISQGSQFPTRRSIYRSGVYFIGAFKRNIHRILEEGYIALLTPVPLPLLSTSRRSTLLLHFASFL